ncbi:16S rRNA pseudouridine(516) synthase [Parendozoicomonas haliclonae]|uniref:Pseudouridine synthase n=1 Tax=Parendozoicomonas haliclonae TaxID=1960125 RepID=A0A1X7AF10_9GAMM|nr:pseudouridine synthase [Parendozoicomonas haliclonae]SMA34356.1 Ribosomal small subunit pseudouridine synthase A [Parendozoicomonas haliclonae]
MRLDRLLGQHPTWGRQQIKAMLAQREVLVDHQVVTDGTLDINQFQTVTARNETLQQGKPAIYLMMNKPTGWLSATSDPVHTTVMELLPVELRKELHIAGRLDRASSGLLILTNDGLWSRRLTDPDLQKAKVYHVTTGNLIAPDTRQRFAEGIYFPYENITTSPAQLEQLSDKEARLTIYEGRYHQIKRMFGRFRNPVTGLHRESMGDITLDECLAPGEFRHLSAAEIASV